MQHSWLKGIPPSRCLSAGLHLLLSLGSSLHRKPKSNVKHRFLLHRISKNRLLALLMQLRIFLLYNFTNESLKLQEKNLFTTSESICSLCGSVYKDGNKRNVVWRDGNIIPCLFPVEETRYRSVVSSTHTATDSTLKQLMCVCVGGF